MGSSRIINTEIAVKEGKEIHSDKYDYSLTEYINCKTPLVIICPVHGEFKQSYQKHCKLGRGCWDCGKKSCVEKREKKSSNDFINQAKIIHKNKYTYDKTVYNLSSEKVIITCPLHGDFLQNASSHLMGCGCNSCARIKIGLNARTGKETILQRFKEKHGDFYTYYIPEDIITKDLIEIICPLHGAFEQRVEKHFLHGCPKCGDERTASKTRKIPKELVKLSRNVKRSVKSFIKRQGYSKKSNTYQILGASWEELKNHLENNSYGFTIYCDDINIDHIIPLATIKEESDIYTLNHYSNLQLLPKEYNQHIKKDKPFNKKHFESWLNETNYNKC